MCNAYCTIHQAALTCSWIVQFNVTIGALKQSSTFWWSRILWTMHYSVNLPFFWSSDHYHLCNSWFTVQHIGMKKSNVALVVLIWSSPSCISNFSRTHSPLNALLKVYLTPYKALGVRGGGGGPVSEANNSKGREMGVVSVWISLAEFQCFRSAWLRKINYFCFGPQKDNSENLVWFSPLNFVQPLRHWSGRLSGILHAVCCVHRTTADGAGK